MSIPTNEEKLNVLLEKIKVLLVEDNEIDQEAFLRSHQKNNLPYHVEISSSIEKTRELIKSNDFDVAIIDYLLDDGNGLELIPNLMHIPIIFVTGEGDLEIAVRAMKDGAYDYIVKDHERNYLNILPKIIDVAYREKKAKEKLREAETNIRRFSLALSKVDNSVIISDQNGAIIYVNNYFSKLTGYGADEVLGTYGDKLMTNQPSGLNPESEVFKACVKERKSISFENMIKRKDGKQLYVLTTISPIFDENKKLTEIVSIDLDITRQKQTEQVLLNAKLEAESASRSKELFLANMSHEIRTPMNAILGMAQLLKDTELDAKQQEYVNVIDDSSNNLLVIINDILDFSKINAGKISIEQTPFNIKKLIKGIHKSFSLRINQNEVKLKTNVDVDLPETLEGDPVRLNQVVSNILSNSAKFTHQGYISLSVKKLQSSKERTKVSIVIEDSGIGIPKEKVDQLFHQFTQASEETTRKYGGTGLGLAIVKQLAELMGGSVRMESEPGKGTKTFLELSFKNTAKIHKIEDPDMSEQAAIPDDAFKGKNVLLVEDNTMNQLLGVQFLKKMGIHPDVAKNGAEAVDMIRSGSYDVILMDLQMPVMDGYEATKIIRRELASPKNTIPIIAMTAHALNGVDKECLRIGMNDYISKPIKYSTLRRKLFGSLTPV